jgi:transcriptional regulator with XRE-family HTH domain
MTNATQARTAGDLSISEGTVGARVKSLREAMDLSLRDLAERSGVSAPMLSQVERGDTSPTLAIAEKIASGLDLTLSQLLRLDEDRHVVVVRAGQGRTRHRRGHRLEELTPPLPGLRADVSVHTPAPGAATGAPDDPPVHEPGSRETTVVVEGTAELSSTAGGTSSVRATASPSTPICRTISRTMGDRCPADRGGRRRAEARLGRTDAEESLREDLGSATRSTAT